MGKRQSKRAQLYQPAPQESDSLSYQPAPQAYDAKALFNRKKEVPHNVVTRHAAGPASPNDGTRALDIAAGRRNFVRPENEQ
jgi:hypothetical protein